VTHKCLPIVQDLIDDPFGWVFIDAVDPVALGLPDYFEVVKNPMHLELVKKKLENAIYADMDTFERDVKLVFENAILYNGEESEVGQLAQSMLVKFEQLYKDVVQGKCGNRSQTLLGFSSLLTPL
jgi:Bromodomain